jgi:hypothetical protein
MPRRDEYDDDRYDDEDRPRRRDDRDYDDYDQRSEDYDDRPRRTRRDAAAEKVAIPAIFMMVLGGIGFAAAVANAVFVVIQRDEPNPIFKQDPAMKDDPAYIAGQVATVIATILWGIIVFFGGLQMKGLRSRGFVVFSCIWAMLPCNWCCLIGLPVGIWALVTVNDESVKRAF